MASILIMAGSAFIGLAALAHVLFFWFESIVWSNPSTWKRFGIRTQSDADVVRPMAYNQGYYNLFLALGAGAGITMIGIDAVHQAGIALALFAALSMVLAATVLVTSSPKLARAAAIQGLPPLIGIILLAAGLLAGG